MQPFTAAAQLGRYLYLIGINLPGRNLPIFEKGGKFLPGNLKHGQVMERRLKKKLEEFDSDDDDDRDLVIPLIHNHDDII